jgi:hypothetical protein
MLASMHIIVHNLLFAKKIVNNFLSSSFHIDPNRLLMWNTLEVKGMINTIIQMVGASGSLNYKELKKY